MTSIEAAARPGFRLAPPLFALTVFASAGLVFMVQPMVTKLVLPLLGGSPSVWNTSQVFFQAALLAGYGYAHLLQRVGAVRLQALIHCGALLAAAIVLPLQVTGALGDPSSARPALWLLGVLGLSIGAPFAVLSATAPLVQAWYARTFPDAGEGAAEPYVLYAASNLGSLLALLAYPALVEPLTTLRGQTLGWSGGYVLFVALMASLALVVARGPGRAPVAAEATPAAPSVSWRDRAAWLALSAIPSSLMLGVTTHITMDVASAPLLWVAPLALYLSTFIIAFQAKPLIPKEMVLLLQAAAVVAVAVNSPFTGTDIVLALFLQLSAFFLTALMCHQALVARRPHPAHLTEFYLWMSLGGVVGGAFNAFLAPVVFTNVWEYPLVLALSCLARPLGGRLEPWRWALLLAGVGLAVAAPVTASFKGVGLEVKLLLSAAMVLAFLLRGRALTFFAMIAVLCVAAQAVGDRTDVQQSWRSFFGVLRQSQMPVPGLGGTVKMLSHGTTLHGAQAQDPRYRCRPLVYYAPETPIGQAFSAVRAEKATMDVGAVGLGTGAVAAYTRPGDRLTFFEIDPLVVRIATDPRHFTYTTECARGRIDYVVGDARLTLARQPKGRFDLLLIDAFSSDSVPAHLLTVEAVRGYLDRLKPDGVLVLHLSNRHLELRSPAMAVAEAAGGHAMLQRHEAAEGMPALWESAEDVVIVGRTQAALAPFEHDARWQPADARGARPWTDDYMNLLGAIYGRLKERWTWLPD